MRRSGFLLLVASLALVVAGCGQGANSGPDRARVDGSVVQDPVPDPKASTGGDTASSGMVVGGGLTIPEAIGYEGDQVLAVQGFILRDEQTDRLCELLAESYPPQCGGASLTIVNPEATSHLVLIEAGGVQWSEGYVTVFGRISDGRLTIDTTVNG